MMIPAMVLSASRKSLGNVEPGKQSSRMTLSPGGDVIQPFRSVTNEPRDVLSADMIVAVDNIGGAEGTSVDLLVSFNSIYKRSAGAVGFAQRRTQMTATRAFDFQPIAVNDAAPGGACVLRTFDDIGAFILNKVDLHHRLAPHWTAVRRDLIQARFGARCAEVHEAMRRALFIEGWLG